MPFCYWGALKCVTCDAFLLSLQPLTLHTGGCPRPVLLILPPSAVPVTPPRAQPVSCPLPPSALVTSHFQPLPSFPLGLSRWVPPSLRDSTTCWNPGRPCPLLFATKSYPDSFPSASASAPVQASLCGALVCHSSLLALIPSIIPSAPESGFANVHF